MVGAIVIFLLSMSALITCPSIQEKIGYVAVEKPTVGSEDPAGSYSRKHETVSLELQDSFCG
jgi:hypothetical protein